MIRFLKRTMNHYAAHGVNCSIVVQSQDKDLRSRKQVTLTFRKGREDEGEAVQMELLIEEFYDSGRSSNKSASASVDAVTWAAIIDHVKENRELDRKGVDISSKRE